MSFLSTVSKDAKVVWAWLTSSKGQAIIAGGEGVVEAGATALGIGAPVQAGIDLLNKWAAEIFKVEALSAAAAQQSGSGPQKAAAVLAAMTPEATSFATQNGLPAPTAASLNTINTALVTALNALGTPAA